ncbi:hypothetical protein L873DRAFT_1794930 [Choiromyces venosus 120613-1]|uniref:Uncharacterized protein n=1 Tax=Choiromyces venosus 120613-1 TaxID=1336337 RepID=A0A3N4IYS2_9PEZI|nr:hypothetical protein L873DRAFT_1794930 [Choiromyces venosus 120613-1]
MSDDDQLLKRIEDSEQMMNKRYGDAKYSEQISTHQQESRQEVLNIQGNIIRAQEKEIEIQEVKIQDNRKQHVDNCEMSGQMMHLGGIALRRGGTPACEAGAGHHGPGQSADAAYSVESDLAPGLGGRPRPLDPRNLASNLDQGRNYKPEFPPGSTCPHPPSSLLPGPSMSAAYDINQLKHVGLDILTGRRCKASARESEGTISGSDDGSNDQDCSPEPTLEARHFPGLGAQGQHSIPSCEDYHRPASQGQSTSSTLPEDPPVAPWRIPEESGRCPKHRSNDSDFPERHGEESTHGRQRAAQGSNPRHHRRRSSAEIRAVRGKIFGDVENSKPQKRNPRVDAPHKDNPHGPSS